MFNMRHEVYTSSEVWGGRWQLVNCNLIVLWDAVNWAVGYWTPRHGVI